MLVKIADLDTATPEDLARAAGAYLDYMQSLRVDIRPHRPRPAGIHASEVMGCMRKLVYTMRGIEKVDRANVVWKQRMKMGEAIHTLVQRDLEDMAAQSKGLITFESEVPITPDTHVLAARWGIHSSADGVITYWQRKENEQALRDYDAGDASPRTPVTKVLVEIKSKAPDSFEKLRGPEPDHIDQAHVYMACLNIPVTWFIYWNKGDQTVTPSSGPFLVKFDATRWARIEERMAEAWKYLEDPALATVDAPVTETVVCQFCPYSWKCAPATLNKKGRLTSLPVVKT